MPVESHASLAFDSFPPTLEQPLWADHSGLQVATLTTRPLLAAPLGGTPLLIGAREMDSSADGLRHDFALRPGAHWADGSPVCAADYADALLRAAASPTATGYWLRHVDKVSSLGDRLHVRLSVPDFGFPHLTTLPAAAPHREVRDGPARHDGAGSYRITACGPRTISLARQAHAPEGLPGRLVLRRVKDPDRGLDAYAAGRVDMTSDTAFPYRRLADFADDPALAVRQLGIVVTLCFEGALAEPAARDRRLAIQRATATDRLAELLPAPLLPRSDFLPEQDFPRGYAQAARREQAPVRRAVRPRRSDALRISYDTYYPNREIAAAVAHLLHDAGIPTVLVPDRYENRTAGTDLRVNLFRGLHPDRLGIYRGLAFMAELRSHSTLDGYVNTLRRFDAAPATARSTEEAARDLTGILARDALCVPLAEVPGVFLSRLAKPLGEWT
ncbi:ABC transporter substrate-binding protein [Streptomyces sp. NPDC058657]|uniref:ABC transporter substrate-binding protein n=1 Tax=unclassified Streptomyces TaxID=2593676 RepID=UPI00366599CC